MAKLSAGVVLRHPGSGAVEFLPAGSPCPLWAEPLLGQHVLGDATGERVRSEDQPAMSEASPAAGDPPPLAGRGSDRARWRAYAARHGVGVDEDATREDIIGACQAAGVRTE